MCVEKARRDAQQVAEWQRQKHVYSALLDVADAEGVPPLLRPELGVCRCGQIVLLEVGESLCFRCWEKNESTKD